MNARQGREAEALYRRLLELMPGDPLWQNDLAYVYADLLETNLGEAERLVNQALKAAPEEGMFLDTLAWVYYKQKRLPEALTVQQRAVQAIANYPDLRFHLGAIQEARGDL